MTRRAIQDKFGDEIPDDAWPEIDDELDKVDDWWADRPKLLENATPRVEPT